MPNQAGGAPAITVVVPLHNKGAYIEDALKSAIAQTLQPIEILVIDDASQDGGDVAVEAMRAPLVRLLRRDTPGPGGYAARNRGIAEARGEWVAFLDADDAWKPTHLEEIGRALEGVRCDVGAVFAGYFNVTGNVVRRARAAPEVPALHPLTLTHFLRGWLALRDCPMLTSATAVRRSVLKETGGFPADRAKRGGDKDLWLRVVAAAPAIYTAQYTTLFRRDATNKVTKTVTTNDVPAVCATIARMRQQAQETELRSLLERLANQEICLYARQAFLRAPLSPSLRRALYVPRGMVDWLALLAMERTPLPIAALLRRAFPSRGLHAA